MADIIRLLPDHVANQIAAGEVVQRPASVVKELLENSVDAGATKIELVVEEAGKTRLQVIDNGFGMSPADARMAFERHATSKINLAEDIFRIRTKGFRGEALASIAAVAKVQLKTRSEEAELGTEIKIEGGQLEKQDFCQCPKGTRVAVDSLFYNIPARRNFLKSDAVELRHIIDEFERVALAHPDLHFRMVNNGHDLFDLPPEGRRQRIVHIFGKRFREKLVPAQEKTPILALEGFIVKPEFARKTRGEQFFFANGRFIRNTYLHKAVLQAFEGLLPDGAQPGYFLYLELDPNRIDVNIHPTKTEVKFEDDRAIFTIIRTALKHALGQYSITPSLDFEADRTYRNTPPPTEKPSAPGITINPHFNPFEQGNFRGSASQNKPISRDSQEWESLLNQLPEVPQTGQGQMAIPASAGENSGKVFLQIGKKYLVSKHGQGTLMVHQNRAHQRILYEKLLRNLASANVASQQLLFPENISLQAGELELLEAYFPALRAMGFDVDRFGQGGLVIQAVPLALEGLPLQAMIEEILENEKNLQESPEESQKEKMAQIMAKVAALRSGTFLAADQRAQLVDELFACESPYFSPEGKKVVVHTDLADFDKAFD